MAIGKWIGGFLGFITGGPLGGLAGLALGALFDVGIDQVNEPDRTGQSRYSSGSSANFYQRNATTTQQQRQQGERNSFLFSLLVLSAYIIRADGKVMHSEMETLRAFLRRNFGEMAVEQGDNIIRNIFDQQKQMGAMAFEEIIRDSCFQITAHMNSGQRLQLLSFLAELSKADGRVDPSEVDALRSHSRFYVQPRKARYAVGLQGFGHLAQRYQRRSEGCLPQDGPATPPRPRSNSGRRHTLGCREEI